MKTKICGYAGCNCFVINDKYFCQKHRAIYEKNRKEQAFKSATRYADYSCSEWRRLRNKVLAIHKCCQKCGVSGVKLHVHHIEAVRVNPERFLDESNLIVLCESCHSMETQKEIDARRKTHRG